MSNRSRGRFRTGLRLAAMLGLALPGVLAQAAETPPRTLLLVGDWPLQRLAVYAEQGLLDRRLAALCPDAPAWQTRYIGTPGPVSYALASRLKDEGRKADCIVVAYGQLDLQQKEVAADPAVFETNLRRLLARLETEQPQARLILATAIPYAPDPRAGRRDPTAAAALNEALDTRLNERTRALAREKGLPLLDLYHLFQAAGPERLVSFSGRFPTLLGRQLLAEAVCQGVAHALKGKPPPDLTPVPIAGAARFAQLLLLGDSVTALSLGMPTMNGQLEQALNRACDQRLLWDVNNVGVGGESVPGALARIQLLLDTCPPDYITVSYGLNDMYFTEAREDGGVFERNLRALLRALREHPSRPQIVLLTCTPLHDEILRNSPHRQAMEAPHFARGGPNRVLATRINPVTRRLAVELDLPLLDIHRRFMAGDIGKLVSKDGVHPSAEGGALLASCVQEGLGQLAAARELQRPDAMAAEAQARALLQEAERLRATDAAAAREKLQAAGGLCPYLAPVWLLLDELEHPPAEPDGQPPGD